MECMGLSITPPHPEHIALQSPGADSTSPEGTCTHNGYNWHGLVNATDPALCSVLVPLRWRLAQRLARRRYGPGVQGWRVALSENLLTLWWRLLETMSVHWVSKPERWQSEHTHLKNADSLRRKYPHLFLRWPCLFSPSRFFRGRSISGQDWMWRQGWRILRRPLLAHRAWGVCRACALQQRRHPALSLYGRDCHPTWQRLLPWQGKRTRRDTCTSMLCSCKTYIQF